MARQPQKSSSPNAEFGEDDRVGVVFAHMSAALAWGASAGLLAPLGPLLVRRWQKGTSRIARDQAGSAFNFALIPWAVAVAGWVLSFSFIGTTIGVPVITASGVIAVLFATIGTLKGWHFETYRYPIQIRAIGPDTVGR